MRPVSLPRTKAKQRSPMEASLSSEVPQTTRARVLAEASGLFTAHAKCKDLWNALQVADYKKEGVLNEAAVVVLFEKESRKFRELLLVNNSDELVALLDEFEDGCLTEDEQILIFSLIKERMQAAAIALCDIHEYSKYREMMKAVRALEADIIVYQDELRKRTHERELQAYKELGEDKLQRFQEEWARRFEAFNQESTRRLEDLKQKQAKETQDCFELTMKRERSVLTARPSARIRTLQIEERLVAVNERFNEAQKIRTELKHLERDEQTRLTHFLQSDLAKRQRALSLQHDKERKQVQQKLQSLFNTLTIEMKQQRLRLEKEIHHHFNDITKNQNLAKKLARKMGETRDELRRTKKKAKEMMKVMSEAKGVPGMRMRAGSEGRDITGSSSLPILRKPTTAFSSTMRSTATSSYAPSQSPLREFVRDVTHFHIAPEDPISEGPINTQNVGGMGKLAEELAGKRNAKSALKSVGRLYNDALEPIDKEAD